MNLLRRYIEWYRTRTHLRPWALITPIVVLLICLPMLRPLRHPDPRTVSEDERVRLATIQAITERETQELPKEFENSSAAIRVGEKIYSNQPPVMAFVLSAAYWVLLKTFGLSLEEYSVLTPYLLTVIGVTLPVASVAGLIYRMGRLFELSRPRRAMLAFVVIMGSGLLSYAVVLNSHAPAAALVLCAASSLIHITIIRNPNRSGVWLVVAGFCAALAAVVDSAAMIFVVLFALVVLSMRWRIPLRIGGVLLYVIGLTPPFVLHAVLTVPITGDLLPGILHPELSAIPLSAPNADTDLAYFDPEDLGEESSNSLLAILVRNTGRILATLVGAHGVLSHFPVLIFGILGTGAVMHRHWPAATKMLATVTLAAGAIMVITYATSLPNWRNAMFANRWLLLFLPLTMFWAGAWMRRNHRAITWIAAGVVLALSAIISILGATGPFPRNGFEQYTASEALQNLFHSEKPAEESAVLARANRR